MNSIIILIALTAHHSPTLTSCKEHRRLTRNFMRIDMLFWDFTYWAAQPNFVAKKKNHAVYFSSVQPTKV